jgi:hypothetical protein
MKKFKIASKKEEVFCKLHGFPVLGKGYLIVRMEKPKWTDPEGKEFICGEVLYYSKPKEPYFPSMKIGHRVLVQGCCGLSIEGKENFALCFEDDIIGYYP